MDGFHAFHQRSHSAFHQNYDRIFHTGIRKLACLTLGVVRIMVTVRTLQRYDNTSIWFQQSDAPTIIISAKNLRPTIPFSNPCDCNSLEPHGRAASNRVNQRVAFLDLTA
jgi:hypothetical protein